MATIAKQPCFPYLCSCRTAQAADNLFVIGTGHALFTAGSQLLKTPETSGPQPAEQDLRTTELLPVRSISDQIISQNAIGGTV
jgi:hypothetical protein